MSEITVLQFSQPKSFKRGTGFNMLPGPAMTRSVAMMRAACTYEQEQAANSHMPRSCAWSFF